VTSLGTGGAASDDLGGRRSRGLRSARGALLVLAVALSGCESNLITKVSEFDANEAVSVLLSSGVMAQKVPVGEQGFDVTVANDDLRRALEILVDAGLPRERRASLGELFKKEGFVSTASEERIRYAYGLSQELERTLSTIDGVASARVHVAIPQSDPLSTVRKSPSTSIFVRYREPAEPATLGPLVRGIVVRAVEGLDAERVSIAFTPVPSSDARRASAYRSWLGVRMAPESRSWAVVIFGLPWVLLASIVSLVVFAPGVLVPLQRLGVRLSGADGVASAARSGTRREPRTLGDKTRQRT